jgi:hypothetical protein
VFVMDVPFLSGANGAAPSGEELAAALSPQFLPAHFDASAALGRHKGGCACGCCCGSCSKDGGSKSGGGEDGPVMYSLEAISAYGERHYVSYVPARRQPGAWWELNDGAAAFLPSLQAVRERMRAAARLPVLVVYGTSAPEAARRRPAQPEEGDAGGFDATVLIHVAAPATAVSEEEVLLASKALEEEAQLQLALQLSLLEAEPRQGQHQQEEEQEQDAEGGAPAGTDKGAGSAAEEADSTGSLGDGGVSGQLAPPPPAGLAGLVSGAFGGSSSGGARIKAAVASWVAGAKALGSGRRRKARQAGSSEADAGAKDKPRPSLAEAAKALREQWRAALCAKGPAPPPREAATPCAAAVSCGCWPF